MTNVSKILNCTRQQRLDFLQAKIRIQQALHINEQQWNAMMLEVGEYFVNKVWQDSEEAYRKKILTDESLGFWITFKYEWMKNDYDLMMGVVSKNIDLVSSDVFLMYKKHYFKNTTIVRETIIYKVENY